MQDGQREELGSNLPTPPVNIGPRSTPNYERLATQAVRELSDGAKVFVGQRDDAFFVDLGSAFDLAGLRPLNSAHAIKLRNAKGVDGVAGYNTHSIAIQVPKKRLTAERRCGSARRPRLCPNPLGGPLSRYGQP